MGKRSNSSFDVDQFIRIEETNKDTVIGIANKQFAIALVLPRKIKRHYMEIFRRQGISKRFGPIIFATAICIAIKNMKTKPKSLVLDIEYPGYERLITECIKIHYSNISISFSQIGKSSPAHEAAYFTHTKKRKADGIISQTELDAVIKKTTGELLHFEFTKIRSPHRSVTKKYTKKRRKSK